MWGIKPPRRLPTFIIDLEGFMRGLFVLMLAAVVGAVAGGMLFVADNVIGFSIMILFPFLAGALIGRIVQNASGYRAETISRVFAALVGGVAALVVYWGASFIDYEASTIDYVRAGLEETAYDDSAFNIKSFVNTFRATFGLPVDEDEQIPTDEMIGYLRQFEMESYGTSGFPAMLAIYAESGIGISHNNSGDGSPVNLTGAFAYSLWIIEALVLVGVAITTSLREDKSTPDHDAPAVFSMT
jgi:hypothetical protein